MELAKEKSALRAHYRQLRAAQSPLELQAPGLWKGLRALEARLGIVHERAILAFIGVSKELHTLDELQLRHQAGQAIYLPRCEGEHISQGIMNFYRFEGEAALVDGPYGLREPRVKEPLDPLAPAWIWVPGLAFDRGGRRLGQGGGFYDRYLARPTMQGVLRVGLCPDWALHEGAPLPTSGTDQGVDWLVTPTQVIQAGIGERAR